MKSILITLFALSALILASCGSDNTAPKTSEYSVSGTVCCSIFDSNNPPYCESLDLCTSYSGYWVDNSKCNNKCDNR